MCGVRAHSSKMLSKEIVINTSKIIPNLTIILKVAVNHNISLKIGVRLESEFDAR